MCVVLPGPAIGLVVTHNAIVSNITTGTRGCSIKAFMLLLQDRAGFLWIGTENGLYRYDGRRFRGFNVAEGLPASEVQAIHQTQDGTLWVATPRGLARLRGERFEAVDISPGTGANAVNSDSFGRLYVGLSQGPSGAGSRQRAESGSRASTLVSGFPELKSTDRAQCRSIRHGLGLVHVWQRPLPAGEWAARFCRRMGRSGRHVVRGALRPPGQSMGPQPHQTDRTTHGGRPVSSPGWGTAAGVCGEASDRPRWPIVGPHHTRDWLAARRRAGKSSERPAVCPSALSSALSRTARARFGSGCGAAA